jgi:hypothetical protein
MAETPNTDIYYRLAPDALVRDGVPKGAIRGPFTLPSQAYRHPAYVLDLCTGAVRPGHGHQSDDLQRWAGLYGSGRGNELGRHVGQRTVLGGRQALALYGNQVGQRVLILNIIMYFIV